MTLEELPAKAQVGNDINQELNTTVATAHNSDYDTSQYGTPAPRDQKSYFVEDSKLKFDVEETAKRFNYLLGLTGLFRHFIDNKAKGDPNFAQVLHLLETKYKHHRSRSDGKYSDNRRRKTEKEEDAELINEQDKSSFMEFTESPGYVNGKLRPYQIQGLNWLVQLYENKLSGILADEMGLGKTLQTISFLGYLRYLKGINGPHLVVVPKSTLDNWAREFKRWTPEVKTVLLQGDKDQRTTIIQDELMTCNFDVLISSYEIVIREKSSLRKFNWDYIVIDEAHRIKNEESLLSQIIRMFHSKSRLLITGTPLQNNLHELWALLNFILPDIFSDSDTFDQWFGRGGDGDENDDKSEKNDQGSVVQQLHKVLQPFLLRRIKSDVEKSLLPKKEVNVYVGMSDMQRQWYQKILEKDIDAVVSSSGKKESKTRLLNIVMQLRKCCNHPYLFEGAEPGPPFTTDEHLVFNAQKMKVLDKLLKRKKEQGSRVLIFSQMSRMLDILEDYCNFREYGYCRIDGQTDHSDRIDAIDDYNRKDSDKFVFLLTTRAGGLGINLTSADTVILYDSDWNPQADLQAMDRAHRIGQTKQVYVYRLVTENAIEEKVLERAQQKLRLDQLVIQQGRNIEDKKSNATSKDELLSMIQHGAASLFQKGSEDSSTGGDKAEDFDIDDLLSKSEAKTQELSQKYSKLGLDDLQNFSSNGNSVYDWDGKNFQKKALGPKLNLDMIPLAERKIKKNYNIDGYYKDVLQTGTKMGKKDVLKIPRQLNLYDHQFYPESLYVLCELEKALFKKESNYKVPESSSKSEEDRLNRELELWEVERARELTADEIKDKNEYLQQGFGSWTRKDFFHFISLTTKYGRRNIKTIAQEFEDKTFEEVLTFATQFWTHYDQIDGIERYLAQIETGELKNVRVKIQKECLRRLMVKFPNVIQGLKLKQSTGSSTKRIFSEEQDRYLILQMFLIGVEAEDLADEIKNRISQSEFFKYDYFFQTRNAMEISRRCSTLLSAIMKEFEKSYSMYLQENSRKRKRTDDVESDELEEEDNEDDEDDLEEMDIENADEEEDDE
ncbi:Isw1b complex ATPase subunit [Komagataella phaffii CBS 7435]|uniref:Member of the imitation-switch (ISWI) class of ATP-dependent chromatin remodeling complexes n=2 Tax=Komagataella phaffii TaxID=460519 RepID=C4R1Z8_KOMPG|nr:Member of the imitation-switch (ISWI) class of ATP-dependent chromatin remodeling complexes [Komagataella phaffii GS115]AOA62227.1 GQ67_00943T0 [Komagataella phaffii]CAH2447933.1 Isw1b complex ATPase subunit [Komagataella phaffii CBS 7435]AOA66961.1 GQ68_00446T0 [Komagataella phaffii GS115]CAY69522.1 Member of the imitation-switch (ISWI) class of ATP-dependent chromatin remodeling complexes [Komagataella phaffii GS115]SCV12012.1 Isw1b complex ATPase subunit [Komagataella phaffii CBS 7435]